jgi:hypothetical protein
MAVEFARKLKDILDVAVRDSRAELRFALHMIADIILETFDSELQSPKIDRRTTLDVMQLAHGAAHTIDACWLVESAVLSGAADRSVREIELPRDRSAESLARFLDHLWGAMENRPFVHVVWRRDTEEILHVGSRRGGDGGWSGSALIDPTPRDSPRLIDALQRGSRIALLIPPPGAAVTVVEIEAALVAVLGTQQAREDPERAPDSAPGAAGAALEEIGQLLCELASKFRMPLLQAG